ncbi:MAG: A24 family peptidase [Actinomycetota bacterium]|nr:prepilin peptidase [Actinomycetota bacterium]
MTPTGVTIAGVGGLLFGSFANVVVWRVPRKESIVSPGSRCPGCARALAWYENIPLVSWVALRGRCRTCKAAISIRYPIVELLMGALFALFAARLTRTTDLIAYLPLVWALVVLSFIDAEHKLLPNKIVYPTTVAGVVLLAIAAALGPGIGRFGTALIGGAAAFVFFFLIALVYPAGMGMGDVKLSFLLGMMLGYLPKAGARVFLGLFLGFFIGAVGGIALIAARKGGRKSQIPFGPYLVAGTIIGVLWGGNLIQVWLGR